MKTLKALLKKLVDLIRKRKKDKKNRSFLLFGDIYYIDPSQSKILK